MQRFALKISYHGHYYAGWQKQHNTHTVQGVLEPILTILNGNNHTNIIAAGRTDAGVHALGQICHVDIQRDIQPSKLLLAINGHLHHEHIAVTNAWQVNSMFHARFDAQQRYYRYQILNRPAIPCLEKDFVWHYPKLLNIPSMQQAANHLLGEHDFTSFRARNCQALTPIKTIDAINITTHNNMITLTINARSFMYHQVRNIVGTLVDVGRGYITSDAMPDILYAKDRTRAGATAPAKGLTFMGVDYDPIYKLHHH